MNAHKLDTTAMRNGKNDVAPLAIFCFALMVRIIYNVTVAKGYIPEYDAGAYNNIALHFLQTNCYCSTERAPLWPYIISFIYFVMGYHTIYPRLFLSLVGSGTCVIIYFFTRDLFDKKSALLVGCLAAVYTGLFIYDGWLYTESLYTFLLTAFTYGLYRLQHALLQPAPGSTHFLGIDVSWQAGTATRVLIVLCGVCLALATLTRPNGVLFFGVVVLWALILTMKKKLSWKTMTRCILATLVLGALIIAPWTYRNYRETGTFILVASGGGIVLSGAYNDTVLKNNRMGLGMWMPGDLISPPVDLHGHACCDYTGDKDNTEYAVHWIETHLEDMPYLLSLHFINMWTPYTSEEGLPMREFPTRISSEIVWAMMNTMPIPIFLLAALGLIVTWRRWKQELLILSLVMLCTVGENLVFYGSSRFRAPIEPLLLVLTGGALWWFLSTQEGSLRAMLRQKKSHKDASEPPADPLPVSVSAH